MQYRSTRDVGKLLGVSPLTLIKAAWCGRINPPEKGPGGAYMWTEQDIEHASWILLRKSITNMKGMNDVSRNLHQ